MTALTTPDIIDRLIVVSATPINTDIIIKRFELLRQACDVIKVGLELDTWTFFPG